MPSFPSDFSKSARAGKDINGAVNEGGQTLLHVSAQNGDAVAVERLIKLGADIKQRDINGQTPLYAAVAAQNIEAVTLLLTAGATFADEDDAGIKPLHWAIRKKASVEFVEKLRALGASLDAADNNGRTVLHAAAAGNNTEVLAWLLKTRLSVDTPDSSLKTPLHAAVENGAHEAISLLLDGGADPLLRTSEIKTPLYLAAEKGDAGAVDILLARPDVCQTINDFTSIFQGYTPLHAAVEKGHVAVAEKLLDVGAYINHKDLKNRHSLFIAAETGTPEMMKMLISRGADVAKAPLHNDGQSMVHKLGGARYKEKLMVLVEAGADLNFIDGYGSSPLSLATDNYDFTKARVLLELGANPNLPNRAGRRPLERALEANYYEEAFSLATALLAAGANTDIAANENVTYAPLHIAVRAGATKFVKLLLDYGAPIDTPDRYQGATAWLMAAGIPSFDICEMLRQRGADMTARDRTGRGILHYAARSGETRLLGAALNDPAFRAQIDVPDNLGSTPLQEAARSYRSEAVKLLLNAGADPLAYDAAGLTALHHLVRSPTETAFPLFAAALAKKGADWNATTRLEKQTPLHIAARDGLTAGMDYLLRQPGVDLTLRDNRNHTPLMTAAVNERSWQVRSLAEAMKKKNISLDAARDDAGLAALHLAAGSNYGAQMSVTALLDLGADINTRTPAGDTPLHIAVTRLRTDIVNLLVQRGANVLLPNKTGKTALDLARAANRQDLVNLLQEAAEKQKKLAPKMPPPATFPTTRPRPPAP